MCTTCWQQLWEPELVPHIPFPFAVTISNVQHRREFIILEEKPCRAEQEPACSGHTTQEKCCNLQRFQGICQHRITQHILTGTRYNDDDDYIYNNDYYYRSHQQKSENTDSHTIALNKMFMWKARGVASWQRVCTARMSTWIRSPAWK